MFLAHLVNEPCSDPGLYVKLKHRREAFLFDLGDLRRLTPRQLLRVSHVFVSHTHMDHFIGFDYLLRICLGRNGTISMYGPPGFIRNVEGKLAAYTWNLVHNFENDFTLRVTELGEDGTAISRRYRCRRAFEPEEDVPVSVFPVIVDRDDLAVWAVFLDHRVPCLAFALEEKQHINILKNVLDDMGLAPGQWLRVLKDGIRGELPPETKIAAPCRDGNGKQMFTLEEMARRAV
ncbi:MAG TPA: ribonuclease Z, partial [Deltaproteobacteria bacterium]|nr:ribonuclease Z [Deltaproteobacteria bacterium]